MPVWGTTDESKLQPAFVIAIKATSLCHTEGGTTEGSRSFAIAQDDINLNIFAGQCRKYIALSVGI